MHLLDHIPHIRLNFKHFYTFSFMQLRQKNSAAVSRA